MYGDSWRSNGDFMVKFCPFMAIYSDIMPNFDGKVSSTGNSNSSMGTKRVSTNPFLGRGKINLGESFLDRPFIKVGCLTNQHAGCIYIMYRYIIYIYIYIDR